MAQVGTIQNPIVVIEDYNVRPQMQADTNVSQYVWKYQNGAATRVRTPYYGSSTEMFTAIDNFTKRIVEYLNDKYDFEYQAGNTSYTGEYDDLKGI